MLGVAPKYEDKIFQLQGKYLRVGANIPNFFWHPNVDACMRKEVKLINNRQS